MSKVKTNQQLYAELDKILRTANAQLEIAAKFADEHNLSFEYQTPTYSTITYFPPGKAHQSRHSDGTETHFYVSQFQDEEGFEGGWVSSSQMCD